VVTPCSTSTSTRAPGSACACVEPGAHDCDVVLRDAAGVACLDRPGVELELDEGLGAEQLYQPDRPCRRGWLAAPPAGSQRSSGRIPTATSAPS
jgi:hypothetical protein